MQTENTPGPVGSEGSATPVGPQVEAVRLKQGETVGSRFVIDERLRDDVVGSIYRAVDQKSGKRIAIVMLDPALAADRGATDGLRAQTRAMTTLAHKNLVSIFGLGKEGRRRYLAREYVDGQTLAELLEKKAEAGRSFTLKGAYNLVAHVCNALQFVQPHLAHGTLRPTAVLINRTGRVKVTDFGLLALRPGLLERREQLNRWDASCFPRVAPEPSPQAASERTVEEAETDVAIDGVLDTEPARASAPPAAAAEGFASREDMYALGAMLYALVVGRPFNPDAPAVPPEVARRMPEGFERVLSRCFGSEPESRHRDPSALKSGLLAVVESARGLEGGAEGDGLTPDSSIVALDDGRAMDPAPARPAAVAPLPGKAAPRKKTRPMPAVGEVGGFVIPELRPAASVADDGTTLRWLVEKAGIDYGPFTRSQIVEKLRGEEIVAETNLYDIETDRRLPLSEHAVFDQALVEWVHERAELEKRRAEDARVAGERRRSRFIFAVATTLVLVFGGGFAAVKIYESTLPTPVKSHLNALVVPWQGALPQILLPDEAAPETPAEAVERQKANVNAVIAKKRTDEARQLAEEARLAAASELDGTSGGGTGRSFDPAALNTAVSARNPQIVKCLQDEVRRDPARRSFEVKATILPRGDIINVRMEGATPAGSTCVRGALSGVRVPAFDGTNQALSLPFSIN